MSGGEGASRTRPRKLRALIVEDDRDDADLLLIELRRSGIDATTTRVDSLDALRSELASPWEIVISDFNLRDFTAFDALETVQKTGHDIPFIIVSGTIGEETAVEAMKRGAHDFFLKDRLNRLALAIEREVREADNRRERREAIARIAENERRFRAIFNQSIAGIAQVDLAGRIVLANERYARITGRAVETLTDVPLRDLVQPAQREAFDAAFAASAGNFETIYTRPDGTEVHVDHSMSTVVDDRGKPSFAVVIVHDITHRKQVEAELHQAVAIRDDFLAMASHELKTPVTSLELVLASSLRVLAEVRSPNAEAPFDKLAQRLQVATKQVDRLTTLIRNLLDVTAITTGRLALVRTQCDLRDVVRHCVERLQELVTRAGSTVTLHADEVVLGAFDPHAVETVVTNLLANAAKYGMAKPIDIVVERDETRARISVIDRGLGIHAADQKRIFERFERAVPSNHYGGFGIGLWIVRSMVEAHGGTVHVTSTEGEGSSFVVELPFEGQAS